MVVPNPMSQVTVWVPVVRADDWPRLCVVEDAFGKQHRTEAGGPYSIFDDAWGEGRLGIGGKIIAEVMEGLYSVRLRDGIIVVVRIDSQHQLERAA